MLASKMSFAKMLYARILSDCKELLVTSIFTYKGQDIKGRVTGACKGENVSLDDGTFVLFRK